MNDTAPLYGRITATLDSNLCAVLGPTRELRYATGADPGVDLPAHVRAASAIRRHGSRLVILQDDVSAIAVLDGHSPLAQPLLLPVGPDGVRVFDDVRGNKRSKLDLEACVVLPDGRLVALGSGSKPQREVIVILAQDGTTVELAPAREFYAMLQHHAAARDARLNIEGAVIQDGLLRLLQRGNGRASKPDVALWNAILDIEFAAFLGWLADRSQVPAPRRVLDIDLGQVAGVPYGFTDATVTRDGRLAFLACAEDSLDVGSDGPVLGCRFGWLSDTSDSTAVMTEVVEADGRPTRLKLEGIEARVDTPELFDVVADMDRPEEPASIAELRVTR